MFNADKPGIRGFLVPLVFSLSLAGCASLGKGVAEAVLERSEGEDTRLCEISGTAFTGLEQKLERTRGKTKVLMVHGVGKHLPGYSTEFLEKLADTLALTVKSRGHKDIALTDAEDTDAKLGNLRVTRLLNHARTRELLFYELTWSEITADQKALLEFDNSGEYSFRRADINNQLKIFANDTGPDPIIYLGDAARQAILKGFAQSICWMIQGDWDDLPASGRHSCQGLLNDRHTEHIRNDDYVFISHSLGSRITIDGMQYVAQLVEQSGGTAEPGETPADSTRMIEALRNQQLTIFMLSNQLPMLQLGRDKPKVTGAKAEYCAPGGRHYGERMVSGTAIIAFSDPNDLLSYAIPPGFSEKYLDSRLCVDIANVNINVARIIDAFGLGKLANPLDAHLGYDTDDRVIALIAKGIGNPRTAPLVTQKCRWTELVD